MENIILKINWNQTMKIKTFSNKVKIITDQVGIYYYLGDKLHRIDGPAVEYTSGTKFWYKEGRLHRTDGPAIEHANGDKFWFQDEKLHRTNLSSRE